MGFMDKVKGFAKDAAKGAIIAAATSYGMVSLMSKTEYKGCKVSMSGDSKLVFVKGVEIFAEHVIADEVKTFYVTSERQDKYLHFINIELTNGTVIDVDLHGDSKAPSLEATYKNPAYLVKALTRYAQTVSDDTRAWAEKIMAFAGTSLND